MVESEEDKSPKRANVNTKYTEFTRIKEQLKNDKEH